MCSFVQCILCNSYVYTKHKQLKKKLLLIGNFGVSIAILIGGANSGQTFINYLNLACDAEPLPIKDRKDFNMKLEVKYLYDMYHIVIDVYLSVLNFCEITYCLIRLRHTIPLRFSFIFYHTA